MRANQNNERLNYVDSCIKLLNNEKLLHKSCSASITRFVLDSNWDIFPCFQRFDMPIGNLLTEEINWIFDNKNPIRKKYARLLNSAPCLSVRCVCLVS